MRIYNDPLAMIKETERDLFEMGVRYQSDTVQDQDVANNTDFQTIELVGYAYTLTGFDQEKLDEMVVHFGNNLTWAESEGEERLGIVDTSGCSPNFHCPLGDVNPGKSWTGDKNKWEQFLRDGVFSYSYTERWGYQLPYVIRELKNRPNTRQAIMTMYDVHQDMMNWGGLDRVPCSVSYQFIKRGGKLTLIYNQRSCDLMKFFASDVYITVMLLKHVAEMIECKPGRLVHFLGSLHAFAGDLKSRNIF